MSRIKVMTIFGTRPEAIKMAPLVKELEKSEHIQSMVCVTAQHREMLDQVLDIFEIKPQFDLNVMKDRQTLSGTTARVLEGLVDVFQTQKPDMVLVHGDTLTTFISSLAAFYEKIPVGHVEAGLRTFDKYSPFPEEMNRKLTGCIADVHFAPTKTNVRNLLNEGVKTSDIFLTGNTVIDTLKLTVKENCKFEESILNELEFGKHRVILVTAHRRENLGEPLENICSAIKQIAFLNKDVEFVYPVHLNPAIRSVVYKILGDIERVHLIEPLGVNDLHNLMNKCYMVMTDSGGIQEEAPALGKPVLVLRTETERPEAVEAGTVKIVGVETADIIEFAMEILNNKDKYEKMSKAANPYGDGLASKRIVDAILYRFGIEKQKPEEFK